MPQEFDRSPDSDAVPQKEASTQESQSPSENDPQGTTGNGASAESTPQDTSAAAEPSAHISDVTPQQAEATQDPATAEASGTPPAAEKTEHPDASGDATSAPVPEVAPSGTATGEQEGSSSSQEQATSVDAALSETPAGEASASETKPTTKAGERIRGRIVAIGEEFTSLDCGPHGEARIATSELKDRQGDVLMRVDDKLTATVSSCADGILLTLGKKRGVLDAARLRLALENRTPVTGTVQTLNKGGFEVRIGRVRAFCPLSQIDVGFVDNPQSHLGKSMSFRVLRWENHGRNIVVSRRSILREEAKQLAQETRKQLTEGAEIEGVVKRLQPFGAFIDLGGLEGLLHVSRMSHARIDDPTQVVKSGDKVKVRVVKIEHPGTRRERIALALADLGPDPWESVPEQIHVGDILTGSVARLVPFGAFIHLPQGVDGLVHVSELAATRVNEPKEVVSPGQEVQVKVLNVDVEKRRISLSLRRVTEPESEAPKKREPRRDRPARGREKPAPTQSPGSVSLTYTMAEQLGHLKQKLGGRR